MKITINQAEIEEAITKDLLSKIAVADGMKIDIKLRATRGDEGFQADIDINDGTTDTLDVAGKVSAAKAPTTAPATAQAAPVQAEPVAEAQPVVQAAVEDIAAVEAEQTKGKSLFGGSKAE